MNQRQKSPHQADKDNAKTIALHYIAIIVMVVAMCVCSLLYAEYRQAPNGTFYLVGQIILAVAIVGTVFRLGARDQ